MSMTDPAVTVCFTVTIDGVALGTFMTCDGLGVEVTIEQREEGGENGHVHMLPGRMKYTNIKMTRPINEDSANVAQWMSMMMGSITRHTAQVDARTLDGTVVCTWHMDAVIPVKWTGPSFNVDGPKVATETIEFAHHGFLQGV